MNPIRRWIENRRMGRAYQENADFFERSMKLLARLDPEAAWRLGYKAEAIIANGLDPEDPFANPRALRDATLAELKATETRLFGPQAHQTPPEGSGT